MAVHVLDSFAVLALLTNEPGAGRVEHLLRQADASEDQLLMSLINLGEVVYIVERRWGEDRVRSMLAMVEAAPIQFIEADKARIMAAAHIKAAYPLSYADAFAASLAKEFSASLLTGDPEFKAVAQWIEIEWL